VLLVDGEPAAGLLPFAEEETATVVELGSAGWQDTLSQTAHPPSFAALSESARGALLQLRSWFAAPAPAAPGAGTAPLVSPADGSAAPPPPLVVAPPQIPRPEPAVKCSGEVPVLLDAMFEESSSRPVQAALLVRPRSTALASSLA